MSLIPLSSQAILEYDKINDLIVRIKPLEGFEPFHKGTKDSAAIDIKATSYAMLSPGQGIKMDACFQMEIPKGYAAFIYPRSGLGSQGLVIKNTVGVIDSDYRGNVFLTLTNTGDKDIHIQKGDRVCQMIIQKIPTVRYEFVEELSTTEREGGFGSTGIK
jgi:dUTP pyrophosphatase